MSANDNVNPEVDQWFAALDHPLKEAMLLTRQVILTAGARILAYL